MEKYLCSNLNALVPVDSGAPAGTYKVIVNLLYIRWFFADIKANTKHGYGMENEAMRMIRMGPKWIPAKQNGHIVTAYVQQPVTFAIEEEDEPITIKNNTILKTTENKTAYSRPIDSLHWN